MHISCTNFDALFDHYNNAQKKSKFLLKSCIFQEVPKVTKYILRTSYIVNMLQLTKICT